MPEVKLMTPLFDGGMYNRTGRRMRAVFIKEVADGTTTYRLWRKDGKPEIEYPRSDNDRYILHVEVNSYLVPLRMTEFQMIDNCGYLPAVNELYGSKEGRVAFFNELRERDGWNQPTSVSEAMKREEEVVTRLGSQPERWVASISKQLASHVKFYLQSEKNGGLTHPDYVGACVLNKLDECVKLSEAHQEYIQKPVYGLTDFGDDGTVSVFVKPSLEVADAVEILAHELAHVAVGIEHDHDEVWQEAFNKIFDEYNRIGEQMFPAGECAMDDPDGE